MALRLAHPTNNPFLPLKPLRPHPQSTPLHLLRTYARKPDADHARTLEKPTRFNPPSHPSRRPRPQRSYGPALSKAEADAQKTKRYPNMMPPEGSLTYTLLTSKGLHLFITLSVLTSLASYSLIRSFLSTTHFRADLPSKADFSAHPLQSLFAALEVYKRHVAYESEKVAEKRRMKVEDAEKRRQFMRAHGVEPGFLTGSWLDQLGMEEGRHVVGQPRSDGGGGGEDEEGQIKGARGMGEEQLKGEKPRIEKKRKVWLGIW